MTARHAAGHHAGHGMPAIHVMRWCGGSFLVMMRWNRALAGPAAGHLIRRPSGTRERRVEQDNHEQANACGNRTPAIVTRSLHVEHEPISVVSHYSVKRHSLQAELKWLLVHRFTIRQTSRFLAAFPPIRR